MRRTSSGRLVYARVLCLAVLIGSPPFAEENDTATSAAPTKAATSATVESIYPGLATGVLTFATLGELPNGTCVKSGKVEITAKDIDDAISKSPAPVRKQLRKNALFLLEQIAAERILLNAARKGTPASESPGKSDREILQAHLKHVVDGVHVSDAEVAAFYSENKEMIGGVALGKVKSEIQQYLLQQKRQESVIRHIRTLGQRIPIVVSAAWVKKQAVLARDNPVDKARASGKPSLVDFGASGCRPCAMMAPILDSLKKEYNGRLNVLFIHVSEEQVLAARYGIEAIPVQIFYDANGRETFRHVGFFAKSDIEKKLVDMGVE